MFIATALKAYKEYCEEENTSESFFFILGKFLMVLPFCYCFELFRASIINKFSMWVLVPKKINFFVRRLYLFF